MIAGADFSSLMARLFISYNRREAPYAFAVRQWLMDEQGWPSEDIFVDATGLHSGVEWESKLLTEAENAEVMLFLASDHSLDIKSFCYRELQHAEGQIIAVTIGGVAFDDERIDRALPHFAKARQVTALDREPAQSYSYVSPVDGSTGTVLLNADRLNGIGLTLRELGVAPNSYTWTPKEDGPFPGLKPLMEGDEAIFCGRDLEIRDGVKTLEELRPKFTKRALIIQAPSGGGKSSFLRAGLWSRLRRNPGFTPLCIIRAAKGAVRHEQWGLITGLYDAIAKSPTLTQNLALSRADLANRAMNDLPSLLAAFADADAGAEGRRTLLIGLDQAEEIAALSEEDDAELDRLLEAVLNLPDDLDLRLVLTARDDSVDMTMDRLAQAGLAHENVEIWRLIRMPARRFDEIILGPAKAANLAGWPLHLDPALVEALVQAASSGDEGGDALPILALALQRLVANRRKPDGQIDLASADAAAFIDNAVSDARSDALKAANANAEDLRRLIIPRLATWDPHAGAEGAAKRQVASTADLFSGERAGLKSLADAMVRQRLLISSHGDSGPAYEVAHEALLRVPPLGQLIFDCREKFEQARILELEAKEWEAAKRHNEFLVRSGQRLEDAFALLQDPDFGSDLRREESGVSTYLQFCRDHYQRLEQRARKTRRTVTSVLSVLTLLALAFSALAIVGMTRALDSRDAAREQSGLQALSKASSQPTRYPDQLFHPARAIGFADFGGPEFQERNWASTGLEFLRLLQGDEDPFPVLLPDRVKAIQDDLVGTRVYLPVWRSGVAAEAEVEALEFQEAGEVLRAQFADGTAMRWDLRQSGAEPVVVDAFELSSVETGGKIALEGNSIRFRAFGHHIELAGHPAETKAWAFTPHRSRLAVGLVNGSIVIWDARGQDLPAQTDLLSWVEEGWLRVDEDQEVVLREGVEPAEVDGDWRADLADKGFTPVDEGIYRNSLGMNFLYVKPGEFLMGSPESEGNRSDDEVHHKVTLTQGYWLAQYEVQQAEFEVVMGENPSDRKDPLAPVEMVSWIDAMAFCEKLTELERKADRIPEGWQYTLPTEAQWEFACRAETITPFNFGSVLDGSQANCNGGYPYGTNTEGPNLGQTVAVGGYPANPWGFYDMHGNVYEWCSDWYEEDLGSEPVTDPTGPKEATNRVIRGGSWINFAGLCRSAYRKRVIPDDRNGFIGFRPILVPAQAQVPGPEGQE